MIKNAFLLFLLLTNLSVTAQEVIATQGDSYSNTIGSIDFTVGEVVINTGTDGSNSITQGFHQSNWKFVGLEDHATNYEVSIFPNPTEEVLNIKTSKFEKVKYKLYDTQGKLVLQGKLSAEQTTIQVTKIATGSYSLVLNTGKQILKTYRLIKLR
jgi:hypothetical protein